MGSIKEFTSDMAFPMAEVLRFGDVPMIHRTSVLIHAARTKQIAETIAIHLNSLSNSDFKPDGEKVSFLAVHHDDPEVILGDIPAPAKRNMTDNQRKRLTRLENQVSRRLAKDAGLVGEEYKRYVSVVEEVKAQATLESQIVKVADVFDALGEILHEIKCGNQAFLPKLDFTRENQIAELAKKYEFFPIIAREFGLNLWEIPNSVRAAEMPTISIDSLESASFARKLIYTFLTHAEPRAYRLWLNESCMLIPGNPETIIFSGWDEELRIRWSRSKSQQDEIS